MAEGLSRVSQMSNNHEDPRLAELLDVIFKFAAGDLTARGTLSDDDSALDGVMAGINILGEELEAQVAANRQAQQALSESENQLRAVFNAVQDGILVADAETKRFRMANASICRLLGYRLDELIALAVEDIHPEASRPDVARQFERQLKGDGSLATLPVKRKDGTVFHADISAAPVTLGGRLYLIGVFRDITERKRAEQAEELASRDGLTALYNYRMFHSLLEDEIARTQRFKHSVSVLMLDIDHFKHVNDTYGHQTGDVILKDLSGLLMKQARAIDRVCRYGGEEFTVILPETGTPAALQIAERLRMEVERQPFDIGSGKTINIAVSIGVATYPQQANSLEGLVKATDIALYAAKQGGRNRVICYEATMARKDLSA